MTIHPTSSDSNGQILESNRIPETPAPKRSVFMATTALWSIDPHFFQCCLRVQQELLVKSLTGRAVINGRFPELYAGESPVGRSRNALTAAFLKSDCTDLLFIDSDLIWSAEQVERIVLHEEEIVGGCYMLKKEGPPQMCFNMRPGVTEANADGLLEVCYIGTGFLRVRREVFLKMIAEFGDEIWYSTDNGVYALEHDFWRQGVYEYVDQTRRWLSEDWWFCQKAMDIGYKVFADMRILLGHSGNAVYPLSYQREILYPTLSTPAPAGVASAGTADGTPHRMTVPA